MWRRFVVGLLTVALSSLSTPSSAAAFICVADPSVELGLDGGGSVVVQMEGVGPVNICSLGADSRGIGATACQAWYSSLLSFRGLRIKGALYFTTDNAANAGMTSCADLGAWRQRAPYFLETR